jgi:nicotinate-nucleotide adenylyltransferase
VGHLVCAQEARFQLGLDRVLLMPVAVPPHKDAAGDPGPQERLEMCRLAAAQDDWLGVSDIEVVRGGPSFTVDTLRELHATSPGDDLTFIVGGDMAHSLSTWREPEELLRLATLAVADREGLTRHGIEEQLEPLGAAGRVRFFDMPRFDISSSDVRARVAAGAPIRHLVPDAVAEHIARRGLYGVETTA